MVRESVSGRKRKARERMKPTTMKCVKMWKCAKMWMRYKMKVSLGHAVVLVQLDYAGA